MARNPTVIYSAASTQQAYLLKGLLEEMGIAARVVNDAIQLAGGELPIGWTAAARVVVGEEDASEARLVAEAFDAQAANGIGGDEPLEDDAIDDSDVWPKCPACGESRSARCPVCGVTKSSFRVVDIGPEDESGRMLLFCDGCDDHFIPEWYRLCHRCGHDFGDGLEAGQPTSLVGGSRPLIVLAALVGAAVLFAAYFVWLFR